MLGLFKKKTPLEKLQEQHKKVLKEAFDLSKNNRSASDALYQKAADLEDQIAQLSK